MRRSGGLPMYLRLFLNELRYGQRRFDSASLPESLEAYFESVLRQFQISDRQFSLTRVVALLSCAPEPLPEPLLAVLVAEMSPHATEIAEGVREGLAFGHALLQRV